MPWEQAAVMDTAVVILAALIGAAGGIAATVVGERMRRPKRVSDAAQLGEWILFFDRPAWRGAFTYHTNLDAYERVITDTILAIDTGELRKRSGAPLNPHRGLGKSQLRSKELRSAMDEIVMRLENVRKLLGKAKESSRATVTVEIDHEREEIIATLNRAAASFKLTGLPAPSSFPGEAVYTE